MQSRRGVLAAPGACHAYEPAAPAAWRVTWDLLGLLGTRQQRRSAHGAELQRGLLSAGVRPAGAACHERPRGESTSLFHHAYSVRFLVTKL